MEPVAANGIKDALEIEPSAPLIFIGVADGCNVRDGSTPFESTSYYQLGRLKPHFCFPAIQKQTYWCFLVNPSAFARLGKLQIAILKSSNGNVVGNINFASIHSQQAVAADKVVHAVGNARAVQTKDENAKYVFYVDPGQWFLHSANIPDLLIDEPGEYRLVLKLDDRDLHLGRVIFVFTPPPALTEENVSAIESDPLSPKSVFMTLGCKHCKSKLTVYAATKKLEELDRTGKVYFREVPDRFECDCGRTNISLIFLRQAMHGFLGRDAHAHIGDVSYLQRYARSQLLEIGGKFLELIQRESKEEVVQKFLEKNKVLFARFHAIRLFVKPRILGKFNADFAMLDSEGVLTLVEIERPAIRLFKKNGHLRSEINHAYEQVQDWLDQVSRHRLAVLEGLGLTNDDVLSIRGYVIAGRAKLEKREHLRRHMSQPRHGIEFSTFDMLGKSLVQIAEDLP